MKGIVFTEFLELVESSFGLEVVDEIIEKSDLKSEGVYTSVGTYEFGEMLQLVTNLSQITNLPVNDLLKIYGLHFFSVIQNSYGYILNIYKDALDMLSSIESHIHVEVRKIYPDAELPRFEVLKRTPNHLEMIYYSSRSMYAFAEGLMEKAFEHYGGKPIIERELLKDDGSEVKFTISLDER